MIAVGISISVRNDSPHFVHYLTDQNSKRVRSHPKSLFLSWLTDSRVNGREIRFFISHFRLLVILITSFSKFFLFSITVSPIYTRSPLYGTEKEKRCSTKLWEIMFNEFKICKPVPELKIFFSGNSPITEFLSAIVHDNGSTGSYHMQNYSRFWPT